MLKKCAKCEETAVGWFPEKEGLTEYTIHKRGINKRFVNYLYPKSERYCGVHLAEIKKEILDVFSPKK